MNQSAPRDRQTQWNEQDNRACRVRRRSDGTSGHADTIGRRALQNLRGRTRKCQDARASGRRMKKRHEQVADRPLVAKALGGGLPRNRKRLQRATSSAKGLAREEGLAVQRRESK